MRQLGLNDVIDDLAVTLGKQYHLVRLCARKDGVFIHFVLDTATSSLALVRRKLQDVDQTLPF